jgi:hypothetical protein
MTQIEKVERRFPEVILELANDVLEGNADAVPLQVFIKKAKEALEQAEKAIKPTLMRAVEGKEGYAYNGYLLQVRPGSGRHSYDHIREWVELRDKMKDIEDKAKVAYKMYLRGDQYVTEEGELIPPSKYTGYDDTIVITKTKGAL